MKNFKKSEFKIAQDMFQNKNPTTLIFIYEIALFVGKVDSLVA